MFGAHHCTLEFLITIWTYSDIISYIKSPFSLQIFFHFGYSEEGLENLCLLLCLWWGGFINHITETHPCTFYLHHFLLKNSAEQMKIFNLNDSSLFRLQLPEAIQDTSVIVE